jgi:electron transport complex protein RnfB
MKMNIMDVVMAALILGIVGLLLGVVLGIAAKTFAVEVDERVDKVREILPGVNCGACGYPGCDGLAEAIVKGEAPVNGCPVGKEKVANAIAEVMNGSN